MAAPAGPATAGRPAGITTSGDLPPVPAEAPDRPPMPARSAAPGGPLTGGAVRLRGARSELRRQLREQKRVRTTAMALVVVMLLGAPMLYFGILFATRDPVLTSLDRLVVPSWAAESPEDRIISGSRWCLIDCRLRERTLVSTGEPVETTQVYQDALRAAGWARWEVAGCPLVAVDGDYSCWTRDEYTLDLWVRPPDCAYDPLNLRPDLGLDDDAEDAEDPGREECSGSVVEIKMQNRVADDRGLPGGDGEFPGGVPPDVPDTPPDDPGGDADEDDAEDDADADDDDDTGGDADDPPAGPPAGGPDY